MGLFLKSDFRGFFDGKPWIIWSGNFSELPPHSSIIRCYRLNAIAIGSGVIEESNAD